MTALRIWPEAESALGVALAPLHQWEPAADLPPLPWSGQVWSVEIRGRGTVGLLVWTTALPPGARGSEDWAEVANWAITRALEASGIDVVDLVACGPPQARTADDLAARRILAYGFRAPDTAEPAGVLAWWQT